MDGGAGFCAGQFLSHFHGAKLLCVSTCGRGCRGGALFLMKRLVGLFIWLWRRQSRYVSAHDSLHRDAIAKDPAFYDEWLRCFTLRGNHRVDLRSGLTGRFPRRPKFVEFCAAQGWDGGELVVAPEDIEPDVVHDEAPPAGLFARLYPFG